MIDKNKISYWASNNILTLTAILIVAMLCAFILYGFSFLDQPETIDVQPL